MTPGTYTRVDVRLSYWSRREGDTWIWWKVPAHTVFFSVPWVRKGLMSTINGKLGLRPAGKRAMMKLPTDRALRNRVTAAQCPNCGLYRASLSKVKGCEGQVWCLACGHKWELPKETP